MSPASRRPVRGLVHATEVGETVFLRPPRTADRDEYLALRRASVRHLRPFEPRPPRGSAAADPAEAFRAWVSRSRLGNTDYHLACSREDGAILGALNVSQIVGHPFLCGFLGYWCGAPFAGRGVMTEALPLLLRRVFGTLGLHRLEANILPGNEPSRALVRRAGFRLEGYSPRYLRIAGRWQDHERWALLEEDWRAHGTRKRSSNPRRKA